MRISIKTDGGITQLGVMQKTDVIRSYQAQPKPSSDNLRSISDFQKILGHKVDRKDSSPSGNTVTYPADIRESEPSQSTVSRTDNDIDTSKYDGVTIQAPDELADIFHRAAEKYGVDEKPTMARAGRAFRAATASTSTSPSSPPQPSTASRQVSATAPATGLYVRSPCRCNGRRTASDTPPGNPSRPCVPSSTKPRRADG